MTAGEVLKQIPFVAGMEVTITKADEIHYKSLEQRLAARDVLIRRLESELQDMASHCRHLEDAIAWWQNKGSETIPTGLTRCMCGRTISNNMEDKQ